jgi:1,2-diacylglycerol 3-alpha-glucosyltransferase
VRVALSGQTYLPSTNGPAVFTTNLAEALAARGHRVLVIIPSPEGRWRQVHRGGVELCALPAVVSKRSDVAVTAFPNRRVGRLLTAFAPDVVHIQDHYPTSRAVLAESLRLGIPVVGTNHFIPANLALQLPLPPGARGAVEALLWWTVRAVYGRLVLATAPSETAARMLRERIHGLDVRAISCGVDVERFRPRAPDERRAFRARFGLPESDVVALYVGRLDRDKNLELLLRAFTHAPAVDRLVVAGKGLRTPMLREQARRLGLAGRVHFTGYVPDDALPYLYATSDLFVMPSSVELLSIATLEAMASGLPVAAARAGALPELVTQGTHGALFDPTDAADAGAALQALASGRGRWADMARAARAKAEQHRLERTRERFEALYQEVAEPAPKLTAASS